jgi:hypothetical protein
MASSVNIVCPLCPVCDRLKSVGERWATCFCCPWPIHTARRAWSGPKESSTSAQASGGFLVCRQTLSIGFPYFFQINFLVLHRSLETLDESLSKQRPLPSMLMLMPAPFSTSVKSLLVNCEPWSLLKISGTGYNRKARSNADTQKLPSKLVDTSQDSTEYSNHKAHHARSLHLLNRPRLATSLPKTGVFR